MTTNGLGTPVKALEAARRAVSALTYVISHGSSSMRRLVHAYCGTDVTKARDGAPGLIRSLR